MRYGFPPDVLCDMDEMANQTSVRQALPCPCGGFWPDAHFDGCTSKKMAELWPKAYAKELERLSEHDKALNLTFPF